MFSRHVRATGGGQRKTRERAYILSRRLSGEESFCPRSIRGMSVCRRKRRVRGNTASLMRHPPVTNARVRILPSSLAVSSSLSHSFFRPFVRSPFRRSSPASRLPPSELSSFHPPRDACGLRGNSVFLEIKEPSVAGMIMAANPLPLDHHRIRIRTRIIPAHRVRRRFEHDRFASCAASLPL